MSDQPPRDGDAIHEQGQHDQQGQYGQQSGSDEPSPWHAHGGDGQQTPPDQSGNSASHQYGQAGYVQSQQNSDGFARQGGHQQGYYAPHQQSGGINTSAIVLTVVSALSCLVGIFPAGLPGLVLGIIALIKQSSDLPRSHKFSKIGWIVWSSITAISIIAFITWVGSGNFNYGG